MRRVSLVALAALAVPVPTPANASDGSGSSSISRAALGRLALAAHAGIPAWARRYNVNCDFCHSPAVPRLNAMGIRFRWAGYRMPEDIGKPASVDELGHYISLRGRARFAYTKTEEQPATNTFQFNDATFFFSGPFGKSYGAFFELEREPSGEVGAQVHVESAWGKEKSYGGFRVGLMHWLARDGVAGFDRPTGIRTPLPIDAPLTSAIPFAFSPDQLGLEAYYVVGGRNRISAEVLNGISGSGGVPTSDADNRKDFVLIDQLLFDDLGSGLTAVGYYGTVKGVDPTAETATSHFWRAALTANKILGDFEALGGVAYGKDQDLPVVTGGAFTTSDQTGLGYWLYGGYTIRPKSGTFHPTVYGRYEFLDPNTDVDANARRRVVAGWVLPALLPEHLRLALEYALDFPQGGGPKRHGLTAELMLNW